MNNLSDLGEKMGADPARWSNQPPAFWAASSHIRNSRLNIGLQNRKEITHAKTQSMPSSEKPENISSLRFWRLSVRRFLEVILSLTDDLKPLSASAVHVQPLLSASGIWNLKIREIPMGRAKLRWYELDSGDGIIVRRTRTG
jgi:hypothetical protein